MTPEDLQRELQRRAPGAWELYQKTAESREIDASSALRRRSWRREEGWAARWSEGGSLRFAAACHPGDLFRALPEALRIPAATEEPPDWPRARAEAPPPLPLEEPSDLFDALAPTLASTSRAEAELCALSLRHGRVEERIWNGAGLDVAQSQHFRDGVAVAMARRGARGHESRIPFRWHGAAEIDALARRLSDATTLPLSDRPAPFASGQWLLDPGVSAALLAALAPIFSNRRPPRWLSRGPFTSPAITIADDASPDAPFDGEGVATRRIVLVQDGALAERLEDLRSAKRSGLRATGHGVRSSFRASPRVRPRRLFLESRQPIPPAEMLAAVKRGLFAAALTAPVRVDLESDRFEIEFTGVSVAAGRAQAPVGGARAAGRLSELLRRVTAVSDDRHFFPLPFLSGSPTLLVERASFD
ncbi:MAG: metallopeptidase TldD-related protein [Acidobacteriota bacterium]